MLSDHIIKKYFRHFSITIIVIVFFSAFLWINYLYTNHSKDIKNFREKTRIELEEKVFKKSELILKEADRIYNQELIELEYSLENSVNTVRNTLLNYYFVLKYDKEVMDKKLASYLIDFKKTSGFSVSVVYSDGSKQIGDKIEKLPNLKKDTTVIEGEKLYYYNKLRFPDVDIYIYVDYDKFVKKAMRKNLIKYLELDPNILAFDDIGMSLSSLNYNSRFSVADSEDFKALIKSNKTGFYFGYLIPKEELDSKIREMDLLFKKFMNNHIIEVVVFLGMLLLASVVLFWQIQRNYKKQYDILNSDLISAYTLHKDIDKYPSYDGFFLRESIQEIIDDTRKRDQEFTLYTINCQKESKKNHIEKLVLERKIDELTNSIRYTENMIYDLNYEEILLEDLINESHKKSNVNSNLKYNSDIENILCDRYILKEIFESLFSLSKDNIDVNVDISSKGKLIYIYVKMVNIENVDERFIENIKMNLRYINGTFQRNFENNKLNIMISI